MHELSLVEDMRDLILEKASTDGFHKVDTVWLEVGELSCVDAQAMDFCFSSVMAGTVAEGAKLELVSIPGLGRCAHCGQTSQIKQLFDVCPTCGHYDLQIVQGREIRLRSLAVSESE